MPLAGRSSRLLMPATGRARRNSMHSKPPETVPGVGRRWLQSGMEEWRSFRQQRTREAVAYVVLGLAMSRGDAAAHLAQRVEEGKGTPGGLRSDRGLNQVSNCRPAAL